jgi:hypothetical protein
MRARSRRLKYALSVRKLGARFAEQPQTKNDLTPHPLTSCTYRPFKLLTKADTGETRNTAHVKIRLDSVTTAILGFSVRKR